MDRKKNTRQVSRFDKLQNLMSDCGSDGFFSVTVNAQEIQKKRRELALIKKKAWFLEAKKRGVCQKCGARVGPGGLTLDHIVPLSRGGTNSKGNLQFLCGSCNKKKGMLTSVDELFEKESFF